jgi:hypothetical protein
MMAILALDAVPLCSTGEPSGVSHRVIIEDVGHSPIHPAADAARLARIRADASHPERQRAGEPRRGASNAAFPRRAWERVGELILEENLNDRGGYC